MQYVDKGSVVPPPFNLLPSGKYFIEICKRCYDRIISQKVHKSLLFAGFVDQELDLPTGVTRRQCYQKLYSVLYFRGESMCIVDQNLFKQIVSIKTTNVLVVNLPQPCPALGFRHGIVILLLSRPYSSVCYKHLIRSLRLFGWLG